MSGEKAVRRKRRKHRWVYVLILAAVVVVCVVCFFRWRLKRQLRRRIDAIRAAGYPVTCVELDEWYSLPQDAENAAAVILEAVSYYVAPQNAEAIPVVGQAKMPGRGEALPEEMKKLVEEYLAENREALEKAAAAVGIEHSRYPVNLRNGFDSLVPYLSDIRDITKLLRLSAICHAENNEPGRAVESVESIFAVARSLSEEPVLISQLVRAGCEAAGIAGVERIVNSVELGDGQLAELNRMIVEAGKSSGFTRALAGERCALLQVFREPERLGPQAGGGGALGRLIMGAYRTVGLSMQEAIIYLDSAEKFTEISKSAEHERLAAVGAAESELNDHSATHVMLRMLVPAYSNVFKIDLRAIGMRRAAVAGLAIERYRLAKGELPVELDELVPAYLDAVPKDPFSGEELRYRRLEKGYVVYSVGEDLSDDGGRERPASKKEQENWEVTFIVER